METIHFFRIMHYGTTINLIKNSLHNADDKVDILVMGKHEQQLLGFAEFERYYQIGEINYSPYISYKENMDNESTSDDDTYKPFDEENRTKIRQNVTQKTVPNIGLIITEPRIPTNKWIRNPLTNELRLIPSYKVIRPQERSWDSFYSFEDNKAIIEASKDLALCYKNALTEGCKKLSEKKDKSIALPTLSADVGFPREKAAAIAVSTILEFVINNPRAYDRIELFVKKRSEFALYKKLLSEYWKRICLLYCANTDYEHFLSYVPRDVINYIIQLMHIAQMSNI
jgi:hypothetical protein